MIERNAIACDFTPCRSFNGVYSADASPLEDEWRAVRGADEAAALRTGVELPADAAGQRFEIGGRADIELDHLRFGGKSACRALGQAHERDPLGEGDGL